MTSTADLRKAADKFVHTGLCEADLPHLLIWAADRIDALEPRDVVWPVVNGTVPDPVDQPAVPVNGDEWEGTPY